jgi:hypothetical protein
MAENMADTSYIYSLTIIGIFTRVYAITVGSSVHENRKKTNIVCNVILRRVRAAIEQRTSNEYYIF